jgi:hypothetical protein
MIDTIEVRARWLRRHTQIDAKTLALLSDALVTLERRILAAGMALEHRILPTSTDHRIAVTLGAAPRGLGRWNAIILTAGILAEVYLDPLACRRDPRHETCGRILLQRMIPLSPVR